MGKCLAVDRSLWMKGREGRGVAVEYLRRCIWCVASAATVAPTAAVTSIGHTPTRLSTSTFRQTESGEVETRTRGCWYREIEGQEIQGQELARH